jgi:hypothetical protein
MTVLCVHCGQPFTPSAYSNRFGRSASTRVHARFCSAACRQAAYRRRQRVKNATGNATHAPKSPRGMGVHRGVTHAVVNASGATP